MTTRRPSCKQVIVPISNINQKNFINKSSAHVANLNRALKNIKSDVMLDFIYSNSSGIIDGY